MIKRTDWLRLHVICYKSGYLPRDLYSLNTPYGKDGELRDLVRKINERGIRAMADIVINHRIGSCQGYAGRYNRYDGMPMPWDEHAVTCDTFGLVSSQLCRD